MRKTSERKTRRARKQRWKVVREKKSEGERNERGKIGRSLAIVKAFKGLLKFKGLEKPSNRARKSFVYVFVYIFIRENEGSRQRSFQTKFFTRFFEENDILTYPTSRGYL